MFSAIKTFRKSRAQQDFEKLALAKKKTLEAQLKELDDKEKRLDQRKAKLKVAQKRKGELMEPQVKALVSSYQLLRKEKTPVVNQLEKINGLILKASENEHIVDDLKLTQKYATYTNRIQALVPGQKIQDTMQSITQDSNDLYVNQSMLNDPSTSVLGQIVEDNKLQDEDQFSQSIYDEFASDLTDSLAQAEMGMRQGEEEEEEEEKERKVNKKKKVSKEMAWLQQQSLDMERYREDLLRRVQERESKSSSSTVPVIGPYQPR